MAAKQQGDNCCRVMGEALTNQHRECMDRCWSITLTTKPPVDNLKNNTTISPEQHIDALSTYLPRTAKQGYYAGVRFLLSKGANVNSQDSNGGTALMKAAQSGYINILKLLLEHRASVNMVDMDGYTALIYATSFSHIGCIQALVAAGASIDIMNNYGWSALILAAINGDTDCIELFLANGAKPDLEDYSKLTALMHSATGGRAKSIKLLLEAGAQPNLKDSYGTTALICAAVNGHLDCLVLLLEAGALPNLQNYAKKTALMESSKNREIECTELLLKWGSLPDLQDKPDQRTALMYAVLRGHPVMAEALLQAGADPGITDRQGLTAFMHAAEKRHTDCVLLLLAHGSDANISDNSEKHCKAIHHALDRAFSIYDLELIQILIIAGCYINTAQFSIIVHKHFYDTPALTKDRLIQWLQNYQSVPRSLQHMCRIKIRQTVHPKYFKGNIEDLPLPEVMKDYIQFAELDDFET
ncbi:unnamed protein product, partial [Owenia fusiformis]